MAASPQWTDLITAISTALTAIAAVATGAIAYIALRRDARRELAHVEAYLKWAEDAELGPYLSIRLKALNRSYETLTLAKCSVDKPKDTKLSSGREAAGSFQREHVIGFFVDDLLRDVTLASHRIDGDNGPLDRQHVGPFWDGKDFVGFFSNLHLAKHKPLTRRKGRDHVDRRVRTFRPARGLAINGDHPGRDASKNRKH